LKLFQLPAESSIGFYPTTPVKPGHRWEVESSALARLAGEGAQFESGTCKRKFEKMVEVEGEPCAQIADELELCVKFQVRGEWMHRELKTTGIIHRSVERGFNRVRKETGTMTLSGAFTEGGKRTKMSITGPVTIETKWQQRK
jgi:hypothetical protein